MLDLLHNDYGDVPAFGRGHYYTGKPDSVASGAELGFKWQQLGRRRGRRGRGGVRGRARLAAGVSGGAETAVRHTRRSTGDDTVFSVLPPRNKNVKKASTLGALAAAVASAGSPSSNAEGDFLVASTGNSESVVLVGGEGGTSGPADGVSAAATDEKEDAAASDEKVSDEKASDEKASDEKEDAGVEMLLPSASGGATVAPSSPSLPSTPQLAAAAAAASAPALIPALVPPPVIQAVTVETAETVGSAAGSHDAASEKQPAAERVAEAVSYSAGPPASKKPRPSASLTPQLAGKKAKAAALPPPAAVQSLPPPAAAVPTSASADDGVESSDEGEELISSTSTASASASQSSLSSPAFPPSFLSRCSAAGLATSDVSSACLWALWGRAMLAALPISPPSQQQRLSPLLPQGGGLVPLPSSGALSSSTGAVEAMPCGILPLPLRLLLERVLADAEAAGLPARVLQQTAPASPPPPAPLEAAPVGEVAVDTEGAGLGVASIVTSGCIGSAVLSSDIELGALAAAKPSSTCADSTAAPITQLPPPPPPPAVPLAAQQPPKHTSRRKEAWTHRQEGEAERGVREWCPVCGAFVPAFFFPRPALLQQLQHRAAAAAGGEGSGLGMGGSDVDASASCVSFNSGHGEVEVDALTGCSSALCANGHDLRRDPITLRVVPTTCL